MAPRRILIADDDVETLRLVGMMLEHQGFEILAAANGHQAIQKAIEAQPALVILDVMMPDVDGFEVAARLRSHPMTEAIPILMFTAKAAVNDRIAGFQAGADDYLTKPVRPSELVIRVETLLQRQTRISGEKPERGNLIAFLPTKGGLGTSSLALNTAIELQRMQHGKRCILAELQEGNGTLALQLGVDVTAEGSCGLPLLIDKPLSYLTRERLREHMAQHDSGLRVLLASVQPAGAGPLLDRGHVRTILRFLNTESDYLLLDLPTRLDTACQEALKLCDLIFLTVEPNPIGFTLAQQMLGALDKLGIGSKKAQIVLLHRMPVPATVTRNMVEQTLHRDMIATIPSAPDLAYESVLKSKPMVDIQPQGLVAQQVRRVVQAMLEIQVRV